MKIFGRPLWWVWVESRELCVGEVNRGVWRTDIDQAHRRLIYLDFMAGQIMYERSFPSISRATRGSLSICLGSGERSPPLNACILLIFDPVTETLTLDACILA